VTDQTFATVLTAAAARSKQDNPVNCAADIYRRIPTTFDADLHDAHLWCYKKFMNISHLKPST